MRNLVTVFLFFIFGTIFGKELETLSSSSNVVIPDLENKGRVMVSGEEGIPSNVKKVNRTTEADLDVVFSKLKNADKETLIIFNCEGVVFSYLDAAFSRENKNIWSDFYEKRSNFDREKNQKIDNALFFTPKRLMAIKYQQDFKDLADRGTNMVFVYQIDENRMKFPDEKMIRSVVSSMLRDVGLNLNENSSVRLLITDAKKISSDLVDVVREFSKSESKAKSNNQVKGKTEEQSKGKSTPIKKIILVHDGSLKLDDKQINLPIEEMSVNFWNIKSNITAHQMKKQIEILGKIGEWMHDTRIREITDCADDESLIYMLCKQSIMDVCTCSEIIEEKIYEKIASIVNDKASLEHLEEIIDDFQEIYNTLPNIFHYVERVYLWEMCRKLGLEEQKAIEILKQVNRLYFNEYEVRDAPHKIVRRLGCGIHWRDMAKYEFIRNYLMTDEKVTKSIDSPRGKIYQKVLNTVFDKVGSDMSHMIEDKKDELIKILHENKIEDKKIMDVFKISEEKFKNIISIKSLKNEEGDRKNIKKIEKSQKTT